MKKKLRLLFCLLIADFRSIFSASKCDILFFDTDLSRTFIVGGYPYSQYSDMDRNYFDSILC